MMGKEGILLIVGALGLIYVSPISGHTMGLGGCPKVDPVKDFDMSKVSTSLIYYIENPNSESVTIQN